MRRVLPLPEWSSLADAGDHALPLMACALLIARDAYTALDPEHCDAALQAHVDHLSVEVGTIAHPSLKMQAINRHLFEEVGYTGNHDRYYDPRNSYLNAVIERRLGNPISLAIIQMEVAHRLGIELEGISFPGHFLVRLTVDDAMLVMDPFDAGRPLGLDELRARAAAHAGGELTDDDVLASLLRPATPRTMLMRILRNLYGAYAAMDDWAHAVRCADRLLTIAPGTPDALRDRGLGYLALGHISGAREDLGAYVQRHPDADDVETIRERLVRIGMTRERAH